MSIVELSQTPTTMPDLPPVPARPTGGKFGDRTFNPSAVTSAQPTTPAEEDTAVTADTWQQPRTETVDCHDLHDTCDGKHYIDSDGTVVHHGPVIELPDPSGTALRARLARWGDEPAHLELQEGEYDDSTLTAAIATLQEQRTHLRYANQPEPEPPRVWTITTTDGQTVTRPLMTGAEDDPSENGVAPDMLHNALSDIGHRRHYPGQRVHADLLGMRGRNIGETSILLPQIEVDPFDPDPAKHVPTVAVEMTAGSDDWITGLDPAGVADLAAKLRAQADLLDQVAADLTATRADWAANGGQQ